MHRRTLIQRILQLTGGGMLGAALPAWAQPGSTAGLPQQAFISGNDLQLVVRESSNSIAGKAARHITINEQFPAPLLRWREGDELSIRVQNLLGETTSLHWHGILLPFQMDGVPGVSYPGIRPGQEFTYRFQLRQSGTYWYHSHSGFQEQLGQYGPIIIDPAGEDPVNYDREYVMLLSDWTFENPARVFSKLKKMSDNYNFQKRTLGDFFSDVEAEGFNAALAGRMMWGDMRMSPTDLSDVTAATYTYLLNGHSPAEDWRGLFSPGERIRLRFINASAMSIFNVRIPGLPMTVVQADGLNVQPVETDEFQIGVAETFDVVVEPTQARAYGVMCETNDRSGYAFGTLATNQVDIAEVPALRPRPLLTMKDMGMDHSMEMQSGMQSDMPRDNAMPMENMDHTGHEVMQGMGSTEEISAMEAMSGMNHEGHIAMSGMDHSMHMNMEMPRESAIQVHNHPMGPGVINVAMNPVNRLSERPLGLEDEPHRVLVYTDLKSLEPNPDQRQPGRHIELHLTSNMERYMWSFDGVKFSEVDGPLVFHHGERLRLSLVNDTMMPHPIHLHGMFFDVVTGDHHHKPRKHTIVVKPGEKMAMDITADAPGDWVFHCHLLYHMMAGMMRVVSVLEDHDHGDMS